MALRKNLLIGGACVVLGGCQPTLHSQLPQGASAYDAVAVADDAQAKLYSLLQPGDTISVRVYREEELSLDKLIIDDAGNVALPLIGEVPAAGRSAAQLGAEVESAYAARFLRDPHVTISLVDATPRTVSVEGQVFKPGVYEMRPGQTLLAAMALAGSPNDTARMDEVLVFRTIEGQRMGARFDLTEIRAGRMPDPVIMPNDVVVVGFSSLRGAYQDFLKTAPIIGAFSRF